MSTRTEAARVAPSKPLDPRYLAIADALADGDAPKVIAARLSVTVGTLRTYIRRAADRIPGSLPAQIRLTLWARGAPASVLGDDARPTVGRCCATDEDASVQPTTPDSRTAADDQPPRS